MDYLIEELAIIFKKHAKEFDRSVAEKIEKHKKFCPDDLIPHHLEEPFNLSWALHMMCEEIESLCEEIESLKDKL
jgi:hypothetical protein